MSATAHPETGGPDRTLDRLTRLRVVVDGWGPMVGWAVSALRSVGVGRVTSGAYAGEPAAWSPPPVRRRAPVAAAPVQHPNVGAVVAVSHGPLDPLVAGPWHRLGVIHLPLEVHDGLIQVGPLVVPGASACVGCRARTVPMRSGRASGPSIDPGPSGVGPPVDPGVGVLAAAIAALTVRAALLGDHALAGVSCDVVGSRPEIAHRYWAAHPDCPCTTGQRQGA